LVALLGERRLDAREQRVSVPQRRRFGIAPLLGDEQAARAAQVVVLVERERGPIEGVTGARRVGIAAGKIAVEIRGAGGVSAVERLPRRPPQRIGRVPIVRWPQPRCLYAPPQPP